MLAQIQETKLASQSTKTSLSKHHDVKDHAIAVLSYIALYTQNAVPGRHLSRL